jgi:hypothetical protein
MERAMRARCDVAVMGGEPVRAIGLATSGLGVVCRGVVRRAIGRRRWLGLSLESQLSW